MSFYRRSNERYAELCREAESAVAVVRRSPSAAHQQQLVAVATRLGTTPAELQARTRGATVDELRRRALWLLRRQRCTLELIGQLLHRDHSSVIAALSTVERRRRSDAGYARELDALTKEA